MSSSYKHLKDYEYYSELYDHGTINKCRLFEDGEIMGSEESVKAIFKEGDTKGIADMKQAVSKCVADMSIYFVKGEMYFEKDPTIRKWMARDRELDDILDQVTETIVHCFGCGQKMECIDKQFHNLTDKRILLMYSCPDCKKFRAFFNNGEEYNPETRCPKCNGSCLVKHIKEPQRIISDYTCVVCGHIEHYELNLKPKDLKQEEDKKRQFMIDRAKYCLNEHESQRYLDSRIKLSVWQGVLNDHQEKENNKELYAKLAAIKKLNIAELKELLIKALAKDEYAQLEFSQPEIGRFVSVNFSVQDSKLGRGDYDSRMSLKKRLAKTLEQTNWRLMSDGLHFRLGILQGRLRGYENEEELLNLIDPKRKNSGDTGHKEDKNLQLACYYGDSLIKLKQRTDWRR